KAILLCCLALAAAYSTPKKEPKMPVLDDPDYEEPINNPPWPLGRDQIPEDTAYDPAVVQKNREKAQNRVEAMLKAKMASAAAARPKPTVPVVPARDFLPSSFADEATAAPPEKRPLGYDVVLRAGDMVRRVQRFLNDYERTQPNATEEEWMIAFLDEMKSIDQEDNHILTDRLFTVLKERRSASAHH
ncbi:hypothetical protein PENTCL1PPCAC_10122, partial [Pristionchus entomophagus]